MNYPVGERTKVKGQVGLYIYRGHGLADGKPKLCYYYTIGGRGYHKVGWNYEGYTLDDAKEARSKAAQIRRTGGELHAEKAPTWTVKEASQKYLAWAEETGSTAWRIDRSFFKYRTKSIQNKYVTQVTGNDIRAMFSKMEASGLAPKTLATLYCSWRRFAQFLIQENQLTVDPSTRLKLKFQEARPKERYLKLHEIEALRNALDDNVAKAPNQELRKCWLTARAQTLLGLEMGLRRSEWISPMYNRTSPERDYGLRWENINWQTNTIHVRGKGLKDRVIPITPGVATALQALGPRDRGPVFSRSSFQTIAKLFEQLGFNEGLDWNDPEDRRQWASLHTLRHTFATYLVVETGDLHIVSKVMGHSHSQTTALYAHLIQGAVEDAMVKASRAMSSIPSGGNVIPMRR
jgi:site-specific recombinase XerD